MALPKKPFGISVSDLKTRLRENPIGAFAFWGPEEMLKQFYVKKFIALIEKEGSEDFNLVRLDLERDHTVDDILGESGILPFCGEKRMILVQGISPAKLSESDVKKLLSLLSDFPPYLILILNTRFDIFGEDKKDLNKASVRALAEKMAFVSFPLQTERVLLPWSQKILAADSLTASDRALRTLFRLSGNKMQIIRGELEKLSAYVSEQKRREVTEEDVLLFATDVSEFEVYNLCDAVLEGAVSAAEKILQNLKRQDVPADWVAAAISRMLTNAILITEGASFEDCATATKLQSWQYDRYRRSCYGKKMEKLEEAMRICQELDQTLKGNHYRTDLSLEVAVLRIARLCGGGK